jgi:NNP family nitrate/nitrite transporter-like MFS transporter
MRPAGGWISDKYGRKRTLVFILAGLAVGYLLMSRIDSQWSILAAVAVTIFASVFVNAGNGAVYAVVPLVKRRLTGQIAGMTGAYGNVGGVAFLTVLSFISPQIFFLVIAGSAAMVFVATVFFLEDPKGHMTEVLPDGTVQMIEVG